MRSLIFSDNNITLFFLFFSYYHLNKTDSYQTHLPLILKIASVDLGRRASQGKSFILYSFAPCMHAHPSINQIVTSNKRHDRHIDSSETERGSC